jgi:3'-phosphoadenosine 5'-phosphosulfate sulfotransferase (PAPS reductase)/FAD synthetase
VIIPVTSHVDETRQLLDAIMDAHERVTLWLSGGKDSTALLHLLTPWASRLQVLMVDMGADGFPGTRAYVEARTTEWGFTQVQYLDPPMPFAAYVQRYGWPSRLVPTAMDGLMPDIMYTGGPLVSSWWRCTLVRTVAPLLAASQGADAILTGTRTTDAQRFAVFGPIVDGMDVPGAGWVRYNPLVTWSAAQVYAYLDAHQIPLSPVGEVKRRVPFEFPECRLCPYHADYVQWMQDNRPDDYAQMWPAFSRALGRVQARARQDLASWQPLMET